MNKAVDQELDYPAVLPVIHVTGESQSIGNAEVAFDAGADGIFLIDHYLYENPGYLLELSATVSDEFPERWIGVNLLGHSALEAYEEVANFGWHPSALWDDHAPIYSEGPQSEARRLLNYRGRYANKTKYFGGIAHKGRGHTADPAEAADLARLAMPYVDVVTTTGTHTGAEPSVEKIAAMKKVVARLEKPLAIASGITPDNVGDYIPYADAFLVASSIESEFGNLDREALRRLINNVRAAKEKLAG